MYLCLWSIHLSFANSQPAQSPIQFPRRCPAIVNPVAFGFLFSLLCSYSMRVFLFLLNCCPRLNPFVIVAQRSFSLSRSLARSQDITYRTRTDSHFITVVRSCPHIIIIIIIIQYTVKTGQSQAKDQSTELKKRRRAQDVFFFQASLVRSFLLLSSLYNIYT